MRETIYIAGPMRGHAWFNFPAFDAAHKKLYDDGWAVLSPAELDREAGFDPKHLPQDTDWNDVAAIGFDLDAAIARDIEALRKSDAIYMLSGWQQSKGATAEHALAEWMGLQVYYQTDPVETNDEDVLEEALRITRGDRQNSYGPPDQDFARTAAMWSALKGVEFEAREVALFMICLKLSRETHQRRRDNWVDIGGYARCGSLCER